MIRSLDFNALPAGTVVDDEYDGVAISAVGGSNKAMTFDSANPTGDDTDLASDTLKGLLIISTDGDSSDPDDHDGGGSIFFDFDNLVTMKSITFKDIEEETDGGTHVIFYDENGDVIDDQFVQPTGDGGELTIQLWVPGTAKLEVVLPGSGAVDNVVFDDPGYTGTLDGIVSNDDEDALIDVAYTGDPDGDMIDAGDAIFAGEGPDDDIVDAQGGDDTIEAGAGGDDIYAGAGDDVVEGGDGNDIIHGDAELYQDPTEAGDDMLSGDAGADTIYGEAGEDTITGGDDADVLFGGDDADTFIGGDAGDQVDGGDGGNDDDTLDLRASGPLQIVGETTDADGNSTSGTVEFLDGDGAVTGSMTFTEIENLLLPENDNEAPVTDDDVLETDEDTESVPVNVLDNDSDPDGDPLELISATSTDGTVEFTPEGEVVFTPNPNFNGSTTIDYVVTDPTGAETPGTVNVTVNPVNDAPVTDDDVLETDEGTESAPVNVLDNDSDPDGDPLELISATSTDGTVEFTPEGEVVFTPNPDFNGATTIDYVVTDPTGAETPGTVNVTVNPVNDAPVAVDDTDETDFETPVIVDLLGNDTDPEGELLTLDAVSVPADQGTVEDNGDGTVTFSPAPDFTGPATITYTVSDPEGLTDEGEAIVTVNEDVSPPPPVDSDGFVDGTDGDDLIDVDYDEDPDGDFIDNDDAVLPGTDGDDDFVRAGTGDDTVEAGEGSDTVEGGDGDDLIDAGNSGLAPDLAYPFADTDLLGYPADADPEDDRDSVDGGDGNDTITTGDDRDTITGGDGDDVIDSGIDDDIVDGDDGNDRIVGGEGNDLIDGGVGEDTIYGGNDPDLGLDVLDITDEPTDESPFSPDRNPDNGQDTINGGAGNDVIYGADDDDVLSGGSGDDFLDGQIDDDTLMGNTGDDTLVGGQGDDSLEGGQGDDALDGGIGDDTLRGNLEDDTLVGGEGNDVLDGGGDDDSLDGGDGDDTLQGGQGDDLIDGGDGDDVMTGGAGQDTFVNVNPGDSVDGGSGAVDYDTLDLRGSVPTGGTLSITYTSDDQEDGIVNYLDEDGNDAGSLVFEEIENIIPCFTPGTRIATPHGERMVEALQVGDRVITRDNGIQVIRWVGARDMSGAELDQAAHLKPVLIRQGALGNDLPERDMMVSPNHRVLVANDKTALYFEEREVLVAAKHLTGLEGVDVVEVSGTTYIHVMFDQHEVILSDGAWTESFQPGDQTLAGIGNAQRQEILELFPELATEEGVEGYASARRSLKKHEAMLLTK